MSRDQDSYADVIASLPEVEHPSVEQQNQACAEIMRVLINGRFERARQMAERIVKHGRKP